MKPRDPENSIEDKAQDWFLCLTSGNPSAKELSEFKIWREADPRHWLAFEEIRNLWKDLDDLKSAFEPRNPVMIMGSGRSRKTRQYIGSNSYTNSKRKQNAFFSQRRQAFLSLAAVCLVLFFVAIDVLNFLAADYRTGVGKQSKITLEDGSSVYLNTDTAISVNYSSNQREIALLHGEALFEVTKDSARPFSVLSHKGRTTALGTKFSIRDFGNSSTVTLVEGIVQVSVTPPKAGDNTESNDTSNVTLNPGQQLNYKDDGALSSVKQTTPASATAWRKGSIVIEEMSLPMAVKEIERYFPGKIFLLADSSLLEPVTARLSLKTLHNGLEALAATHGLRVKQVTDFLLIVH